MPDAESHIPDEAGEDLVLEKVGHVRDEIALLRSTVQHYAPVARRQSTLAAVELTDLALTEVARKVQGL